MKKRYIPLLVLFTFASGYFSHVWLLAHKLEQRRCEQEGVFRKAFPIGGSFDEAAAKWTPLKFFNPEGSNLYYADRSYDPSSWMVLAIEIDDRRRTKKVDVVKWKEEWIREHP